MLVTISTDNMLTTNGYRTGVGTHWTFLSGPGRKVQKDLDIAEYKPTFLSPLGFMSSSSWCGLLEEARQVSKERPANVTEHRCKTQNHNQYQNIIDHEHPELAAKR